MIPIKLVNWSHKGHTVQGVIERWWPITHDFGLIRAKASTCAATSLAMFARFDKDAHMECLTGPLERCFRRLEPLTSAPNKELYLETNVGWTAYFGNGLRGSDPFPVMSRLSRELAVTAMRVCVTRPAVSYPAVIWEVYDTPGAGGDEYGYRRSIAAANDGGRWVFEQSGAPFDFEDTGPFAARRRRDRFTADALWANLAAMGIPRLEDALFEPETPETRFLVERPYHDHLPKRRLSEIEPE